MLSKNAKEKTVMNVYELADTLGVNLPRAYELTRRPDFPAVRISNRRIVIPKEAFLRWLNEQTGCGR